MVYWLESDTFADDPVWEALSKGAIDLEDRLQAAYCRLKAVSSHLLTNGYLAERKALELCRGRRRVLDLLCARALDDRPPLLHRKGDVCDCLTEDWAEPYAYRIHAFLKRNPARAEVERNKAMKADRRDARLRALVYERDGGCCRYCRSGPLPPNAGRSKDRRKVRSFDHVDPERPAEPDGAGYVLACDRCNTEKGARLPHEADMVLLPEPTAQERAEWLGRELALFDRPDRSEIATETRSDRDRERVSDRDPIANVDRDRIAMSNGSAMADVHPGQAEHRSRSATARSGNPPGSGRAAGLVHQPSGTSPPRKPVQAEPLRRSSEPDIYTRRSRPAPAFPEETWPPGAQPPDWPPGSAVLGALPDPTAQMEDPWTG